MAARAGLAAGGAEGAGGEAGTGVAFERLAGATNGSPAADPSRADPRKPAPPPAGESRPATP